MNQMSLLEPDAPGSHQDAALGRLMARWIDALARKEAIPYRDREARIDADTVAFDIEQEIVESLKGRTPAVIFHRNEWYVVSRSILLKAELINLEESA